MTVDEYIRVDLLKIEQLIRLGWSRYDAVCAVDGSDWHELEQLLDERPRCPLDLAARITAPVTESPGNRDSGVLASRHRPQHRRQLV